LLLFSGVVAFDKEAEERGQLSVGV